MRSVAALLLMLTAASLPAQDSSCQSLFTPAGLTQRTSLPLSGCRQCHIPQIELADEDAARIGNPERTKWIRGDEVLIWLVQHPSLSMARHPPPAISLPWIATLRHGRHCAAQPPNKWAGSSANPDSCIVIAPASPATPACQCTIWNVTPRASSLQPWNQILASP